MFAFAAVGTKNKHSDKVIYACIRGVSQSAEQIGLSCTYEMII